MYVEVSGARNAAGRVGVAMALRVCLCTVFLLSLAHSSERFDRTPRNNVGT